MKCYLFQIRVSSCHPTIRELLMSIDQDLALRLLELFDVDLHFFLRLGFRDRDPGTYTARCLL
ncbi:hypothetical protein OUZ56_008153 [Daphnia magna]|uniref:Uncharacterized protein n=1 Tax=Daphnia magna TaxID=35525 RepID=A0ABR0AC47_9CRUS|nr:hypothetical protein OUZ56_008153 [Daphnia magna]